jgi:hypothetical protein
MRNVWFGTYLLMFRIYQTTRRHIAVLIGGIAYIEHPHPLHSREGI